MHKGQSFCIDFGRFEKLIINTSNIGYGSAALKVEKSGSVREEEGDKDANQATLSSVMTVRGRGKQYCLCL